MRIEVAFAALALGACAGGKSETKPADDPFFSTPFLAGAPADASPAFDTPSQVEAFTLEVSLERAGGGRIAAPRITMYPGQTASIAVVNQVPADAAAHDTGEVADHVAEEGLRVEACAKRAADGGVVLGFSLKLSRVVDPGTPAEDRSSGGAVVKPRMPVVERAEASGTRWLEPNVQGLLARVTSPDGSGPLLVLARVTPIRIDAPAPGAAPEDYGDGGLARPMSGHTLDLRIAAVTVGREIAPGTVLDETAAPDVLKAAGGRKLRDFEVFSCLDSRVRLAGLLDMQGGTRGLVAEGRDDGRIDISWTTASGTRRATIRPNAGRRFVALANVEGGGTAGVIVSVDAD